MTMPTSMSVCKCAPADCKIEQYGLLGQDNDLYSDKKALFLVVARVCEVAGSLNVQL